jgi:hypothetical protein
VGRVTERVVGAGQGTRGERLDRTCRSGAREDDDHIDGLEALVAWSRCISMHLVASRCISLHTPWEQPSNVAM